MHIKFQVNRIISMFCTKTISKTWFREKRI